MHVEKKPHRCESSGNIIVTPNSAIEADVEEDEVEERERKRNEMWCVTRVRAVKMDALMMTKDK